MLRYGIIALLLCSQLIAPALSGQFVCMAENGCICLDGGPKTCHCCEAPAKVLVCSCGCHHEESEPSTELTEGGDDCSHVAIGEYETPVTQNQAAFDSPALALSPEPAVCEPEPTKASLARSSSIPDDSATLAVIATVVLRI